jgi:hypothetical protein
MQSNSSLPVLIPPEIQAQEKEIEGILRRLGGDSNNIQYQSSLTRRQELVEYLFIVILGILIVMALYVLYTKTSGNDMLSLIRMSPQRMVGLYGWVAGDEILSELRAVALK